jgi:hypothetical protein
MVAFLVLATLALADTLLIYNRLAKTGSSTMLFLLRKLLKANNCTLENLTTEFTYQLPPPPGAVVLRKAFHLDPDGCATPQTPRRAVVAGHFAYVHACQLWNASSTSRCRAASTLVKPVYINLGREPIERFISETNYH